MRQTAAALAVGFAVLAVVGARIVGASPAAAGQALSAAPRPCNGLRIGFLAPLSGPAASFGKEQLTWGRFANRRSNQENARVTFRLVERDTAFDETQAQVRAAELAADPRVMIVVGPAGSQEVAAVASAFRSKEIAFISGSARGAGLTTGPRRIRNFFRVVAPDPAQAPVIAAFIRRDLKAEHVWVIDDRSDYSVALADVAWQQLKAAGATVVRQSLGANETNYDALLARMPTGTEVVFLPWRLASRARAFYQQLRARGKTAIVVGSDRLDSSDWLSSAEGQYYASFAPDVKAFDDKVTKTLWSAYVSEFGEPQTNYGPPVFVAMQVALAALRSACGDGKASRLEVQQQVRRVRISSSILGYPIRFRGGDAVNARFWMFRVMGGAGMLVQ
jgi:branched-chain amino acid transport system substrate-binding protein